MQKAFYLMCKCNSKLTERMEINVFFQGVDMIFEINALICWDSDVWSLLFPVAGADEPFLPT
jgi:hypothetical protein